MAGWVADTDYKLSLCSICSFTERYPISLSELTPLANLITMTFRSFSSFLKQCYSTVYSTGAMVLSILFCIWLQNYMMFAQLFECIQLLVLLCLNALSS